MIPIGFGLAWIGYTLGFWGRSLLKGWNISFGQIASPSGYYKGAWPPPLAANTVLFPSGKAADNATGGGTSATTSAAASTSAAANQRAQNAGRVSPGSVASRF